jgi:hypothetical protein
METLEFIIHPDGRVQETISGISGASCAEVTAAIEAQLGRVISCEPTSEYFAQEANAPAWVNNQAGLGDW